MRERKLKNGLKITVEDGIKYYTYPKFRFMPEWAKYIRDIKEPERRYAMFDAVTKYGCYDIEDIGIEGADLEYFNKEVRPELDRQHKRMREGKRI